MPEIQFGFHQLKDVLDQPVTDALIPRINTAIAATLAEYNRQMDALLSLFVEKTTQFKRRYKSPAMKRLQPLDENGRSRPTKIAGYYDIAFPIQSGGDAWGANYITSQKLKVQDINDWMAATLTADRRWVADHILAALFANASWTFSDEEHGDLTVLPLANGDTQPYLIRVGSDASATDSHLLGQAASISDAANPFPMVRRELIEHPENGGDRATVVALVAANLVDSIEGLAGFKEKGDPDIEPGGNTDVLRGTLGAAVPGMVIGKVNNVWVAEWSSLPSGVITAVTVEGDKPLAMREHEQASLQGFKEMPQRNDTPYIERQFFRHAGFGGNNRVGALNLLIGSANWAVPAGYESPMP